MEHPERFDEEYLWQLQQWTLKTQTSPNLGVLARSKPHQLEELRIIDCKVHQAGSELLFNFLNEKSCFISKFSYVNGNLNKQVVSQLFTFIQTNKNLRELDISHNSMSNGQMYDLMILLSKDRKLTHLDLSWNQIFWSQPVAKTQAKMVKKVEDEWKKGNDIAVEEYNRALRKKERKKRREEGKQTDSTGDEAENLGETKKKLSKR